MTSRTLMPVGQRGIDQFTRSELASEESLAIAENVRMERLALERRSGFVALDQLDAPTSLVGAATFNGTTDAIVAAYAAHLLLSYGAWELKARFTAVRPGGNPVGHSGVMVVGAEMSDASHRVLWGIELQADGTVVGKFTDENDTVRSVSHATSAAEESTFQLIYHPSLSGGSLLLYQDGGLVDSVTAIGNVRPYQTTAFAVVMGNTSSDGGSTFEASGGFSGDLDEVTMRYWPGLDLGADLGNGDTMLTVLRRHCLHESSDYLDPSILFAYPLTDGLGTDLSTHKNDAQVSGAPVATNALALPMAVGQVISEHNATNGKKTLHLQIAGKSYIETLRAAT